MKKQPNLINELNVKRIDRYKEIFTDLDSIVPVIDKIGSGFEDTEEVALALLLFLKRNKF